MSQHKKRSFPLRISPVNVTRKMRIWSHLLMESLMENLFFVKWYVFILIANSSRTPKRLLLDVLWTSCVRSISYIKVQKQLFEEFAIRKRHTMKFVTSRLRIIQNADTSITPAWCRIIYPGSIYPGTPVRRFWWQKKLNYWSMTHDLVQSIYSRKNACCFKQVLNPISNRHLKVF